MGTVATAYLNGCNYQVGYDLISQSTENNTSYVRFWGILNVTNSYVSWSRGTASVWGASSNLSTRYNKGSHLVVQQYVTLYHDNNGNYSHSLGGTLSTTFTSGTAQGTFSLPKIDRYPVLTSAPNFNDEENPTITFTTNIGFSSYDIKACISITGARDDVPYRSISIANGSYTFELTEADRNTLRAAIPNGKTLSVIFFLRTEANGQYYFSTLQRTMTIINGNPTFTETYEDTNSTSVAITQNNQQLIRNISTLEINVANATALKEASLVSLVADINGVTYNGTLNGSNGIIDVGILNIANNTTASIKLTDSRGFVTTHNLELIILDWQQPSAIITLNRQSNYYSETDIKVDANYSSLDNKNTITIQVRYKKTSDSSYGAYQTLQDNVTSVLTLDNLYQWDVQVKLTDKTNAVTTYNLSIDKGMPIFYIDRLKNSLGLECFPENNNSLEINGDIFITDKYDSNKYKIYNNYEYSTTKETIVGVWIDGKPIYRKVVAVTAPTYTSGSYALKTIAHNISNVENIWIAGGYWLESTGFRYEPSAGGVTSGVKIRPSVDKTQINIYSSWSNANGWTGYLVLEYTKTTD